MCKVRILRELVKQRLNVAVEEIFGLLERTMADYEEELGRKLETERRQGKLLDALFKPRVRLHRTDIQQALGESQQEAPRDAQQQEPAEPPRIKEEEENVQGTADVGTSTVKSEDGAGRSQSGAARLLRGPFAPSSDMDAAMSSDQDFKDVQQVLEEIQEEVPRDSQQQQEPAEPLRIKEEEEDTWKSAFSGVPKKSDDDAVGGQSGAEPASASSFAPLSVMDDAMSSDRKSKGDPTHHNDNKDRKVLQGGETFGHSGGLESHVTARTREKPFVCSFCAKRFPEKQEMKKHRRIHRFQIPYTCSVCGKVLANYYELIVHMKTHTGDKPLSYYICNKSFSTKYKTDTHIQVKNADAEMPFVCPVCGKGSATLSCMTMHLREHGREKKFARLPRNGQFTSERMMNDHTYSTR
ncbi:zinc finger and BTB domain-containing protein 24-like isoform X2 [Phyllopteryx taeniolatus]|uniref:zinc finger and BTB domain-containing protein 24-like isoform X2 n=1 Tax=Phyllopteryx taeniolatus TaxID=161469 RepID=UPI002AD4E06B|nr:zinc finger and BTB domain-containing protein 24-like isoform X2 [Phyllopteryx taeniolatus]